MVIWVKEKHKNNRPKQHSQKSSKKWQSRESLRLPVSKDGEGQNDVLVVENDVEKRTVDLQPPAVIVNEAQCPEPVHEKADSRAGCAYHLSQSLLTDFGDYSLRHAVLAEMSKQKKNPSEPLFAGIEKLVNQIFFMPDVPREQISYEHVGQRVFTVESLHHRFLLDSQNSAIRYSGRTAHAENLARKRTLAEKVSLTEYTDRSFFASLRDYSEFHLTRLDIKHRISSIPLHEDDLFLREKHKSPALADGGKKCMRVEPALFLDAHK
jgi:hypothetical protein